MLIIIIILLLWAGFVWNAMLIYTAFGIIAISFILSHINEISEFLKKTKVFIIKWHKEASRKDRIIVYIAGGILATMIIAAFLPQSFYNAIFG